MINFLIEILKLENVLIDYKKYFLAFKSYFKKYVNCIVIRAKEGYLKDKTKKNIYIEKSRSFKSNGFLAFRVSTPDKFKFGLFSVN